MYVIFIRCSSNCLIFTVKIRTFCKIIYIGNFTDLDIYLHRKTDGHLRIIKLFQGHENKAI